MGLKPHPHDAVVHPMNEVDFEDAVGEIGNIMMGSAATNLAGLLGAPVEITTPRVATGTWDRGTGPFAVVRIGFFGAADGRSVFILPAEQVKEIVGIMMSAMGIEVPEDELLGELGMSAISEAMNQLMAGAVRGLASALGGLVDITPPTIEMRDDIAIPEDDEIDPTVTVWFEVTIGSAHSGRLSWLLDKALAVELIDRVHEGLTTSR